MKIAALKRFGYAYKSAISVSQLTMAYIVGLLLIFASVSYGSQNMGHVTGKVTVFQKKFFGGLKKKKDMSKAVVYITGFNSQPPEEIKEITQQKKRFVPDILPVVSRQRVRFPNHDDIYHNVFSISPLKSFDLGQYKGADPPKLVTFDKYGVVPVYCNIHPKMIAYVVVLPNTAYALTNNDGTFHIKDISPGTYTINAWRPKAKRVSQEVIIQPGRESAVHMELKEVVRIRPHRRKDGTEYPDEFFGKGNGY